MPERSDEDPMLAPITRANDLHELVSDLRTPRLGRDRPHQPMSPADLQRKPSQKVWMRLRPSSNSSSAVAVLMRRNGLM